MPPRLPLPRLTLFTGGIECSLCEVAKEELASIRRDIPFNLTLFNIQSPSPDIDVNEAKRWRRLYQYDISRAARFASRRQADSEAQDRSRGHPALAGGMASEPAGREEDGGGEFKPYRSVLKSFSAPERRHILSDNDNPHTIETPPEEGEVFPSDSPLRFPPWRRPVGTAFFLLNSEFARLYGEEIPVEEGDKYAALLERTFSNFSEERPGCQVEIVDFAGVRDGHEDKGGWTLDYQPRRAWVEGDKEVLYDGDAGPGPSLSGPSRPRQLCWNCRSPGHTIGNCSLPRNRVRIDASRKKNYAMHDAMPEHAAPYLPSSGSSAQEKARREELLDRYQPGRISEKLAEAVWFVDDDEDEEAIEEMKVKRRRGEWPWLWGMMKWGYPPGWIAGRSDLAFLPNQRKLTVTVGPMEEVRRRIRLEPEHDDSLDLEDDNDLLQIFGGNLGSPAASTSSITPFSPAKPAINGKPHLSPAPSDMSLEPDIPLQPPPPDDPGPPLPPDSSNALPPLPHDSLPLPPDSPPLPPDSPPPLPISPKVPSRPPWRALPALTPQRPTPMERWAKYNTDLFDSDRLMAYSGARPLPLGF